MKTVIAFAAVLLPLSAAAQMENYNVDRFHTVPYFEVDHLGFATMRGRFDYATGKFSLDRAAKKGSFEIEVKTDTVSTGDTDRAGRPRTRDEHLKNPDFFNTAEFPTMTFKGDKLVFKGDDLDSVEGNLTLLGVTKPMTLKMIRWKCGPDMRTKGARFQCGGNATGSFNRSDFGMKFGLPAAVGDKVDLWISFYGFRQ